MVKSIGKRRPAGRSPTAGSPPPSAHRQKPRASGRRPARSDDAEQRILDAAHAVFIRSGTAGARTQEIAREAGVNSALLHYYFRSKERLAEAVFKRAAGQLFPQVIRILGSDLELEAKVGQVVEVELRHLSKAPYLPGYILSELAHHPDRAPQLIAAITGEVPVEVGARVRSVLTRQIEARVSAGTMHPMTPDQFAINLLALCVFPFAARPLVMALFGFDQAGFDQFIERRRTQLAPFFLRALRP
jgi:TetR/AcrR family transcriptional regulator